MSEDDYLKIPAIIEGADQKLQFLLVNELDI